MLVAALRLPEERWTGNVPPQRRRRECKNLSISHRLSRVGFATSRKNGRKHEFLGSFSSRTSAQCGSAAGLTLSDEAMIESDSNLRSSAFEVHVGLQSIRILNRSDTDRFRSFVGREREIRPSFGQ
jgi:hypothetical protein